MNTTLLHCVSPMYSDTAVTNSNKENDYSNGSVWYARYGMLGMLCHIRYVRYAMSPSVVSSIYVSGPLDIPTKHH